MVCIVLQTISIQTLLPYPLSERTDILLMKKIVLILFVLSFHILFAQDKWNKKYIMQTRENDILYFILPFDVPCAEKYNKSNIDVTYISSDSLLTVKMSIITPHILQIDSICMDSDLRYSVKNPVVLFIEKEKRQWLHRISFRLHYKDWKKLYETQRPYDILVYTSEHTFQYAFPDKKWKSEHIWMSELFKIIEYNK